MSDRTSSAASVPGAKPGEVLAGGPPDDGIPARATCASADRWFVKINGKRVLVTASSPEAALNLGLSKHGGLTQEANKIEVERA